MRDPTGHALAAQKPGFNISVESSKDGVNWTRLECGEDKKTSKDLNLCDGFTAYGKDANSRTFGTSGWLESSYDLRPYIGKKIRISMMTHDCSYDEYNQAVIMPMSILRPD
jgi:hypothetical protein